MCRKGSITRLSAEKGTIRRKGSNAGSRKEKCAVFMKDDDIGVLIKTPKK